MNEILSDKDVDPKQLDRLLAKAEKMCDEIEDMRDYCASRGIFYTKKR